MSDKEERCALRARIDRVLQVVATRLKRLDTQDQAKPRKASRTARKRRIDAIQLTLFSDQGDDQIQDQAS